MLACDWFREQERPRREAAPARTRRESDRYGRLVIVPEVYPQVPSRLAVDRHDEQRRARIREPPFEPPHVGLAVDGAGAWKDAWRRWPSVRCARSGAAPRRPRSPGGGRSHHVPGDDVVLFDVHPRRASDDDVHVLGSDPEAWPLHSQLFASDWAAAWDVGCRHDARRASRYISRASSSDGPSNRPWPRAASTSRTPVTSARSSAGSIANGWSGPGIERSSVKCFSRSSMPSAAAPRGTEMPSVWSDSPTGTPNAARIVPIARRFMILGGDGYSDAQRSSATSVAPPLCGRLQCVLDLAVGRHPATKGCRAGGPSPQFGGSTRGLQLE